METGRPKSIRAGSKGVVCIFLHDADGTSYLPCTLLHFFVAPEGCGHWAAGSNYAQLRIGFATVSLIITRTSCPSPPLTITAETDQALSCCENLCRGAAIRRDKHSGIELAPRAIPAE